MLGPAVPIETAPEPNRLAQSSPAATLIFASRPRPKRMLIPIPKRPYIPSPLRTKESQLLFYRLSPPVQTETSAFFPFAFIMLRRGHASRPHDQRTQIVERRKDH